MKTDERADLFILSDHPSMPPPSDPSPASLHPAQVGNRGRWSKPLLAILAAVCCFAVGWLVGGRRGCGPSPETAGANVPARPATLASSKPPAIDIVYDAGSFALVPDAGFHIQPMKTPSVDDLLTQDAGGAADPGLDKGAESR